MHSRLVPVRTYMSRAIAERAQQILEASGISSMLDGNDAAGWAPHHILAAGGITVMVNEADLEAANSALSENDEG